MSPNGHIPVRMCVGCRKRRKKAEMLRFTRKVGEGSLVLDKKKQAGRGFYLCFNESCVKAATKKWRFEPFIT